MLQHSSLQIKTIFWRYLCWRITLLSTGFCPILRDPHRPPNQNEQYHTPLLSQTWDLSDRHKIVRISLFIKRSIRSSTATETLYNIQGCTSSWILNPRSSVLILWYWSALWTNSSRTWTQMEMEDGMCTILIQPASMRKMTRERLEGWKRRRAN